MACSAVRSSGGYRLRLSLTQMNSGMPFSTPPSSSQLPFLAFTPPSLPVTQMALFATLNMAKYYTSFRAEISIVLNEDGAWAKWTWETDFPKANNPLDIGVDLEELAVKTLGKLDDYVVRA
ncbi:hypothetical protein GH714_036496 [Hevea brasiliensis]|uniref:Uncharacterized protein n=1 Tax=Hevea brasiliensis TaxID=3981 RepID=A0A6A6LPV4_HEVBR|nr:hypothetical protein GH714_036496 [Hevea brasiliensis]